MAKIAVVNSKLWWWNSSEGYNFQKCRKHYSEDLCEGFDRRNDNEYAS